MYRRKAEWLDKGTSMDLAKVGQISILLAAPALAFGAAIHLPRVIGAVTRMVRENQARRTPRPAGPPIELIAADLRRLVREHDVVRRSTAVAMRAHHLWALEAAISDCARQAARALGLPEPAHQTRGTLPTAELRRLLQALADAGLVLPSGVGLLGAD